MDLPLEEDATPPSPLKISQASGDMNTLRMKKLEALRNLIAKELEAIGVAISQLVTDLKTQTNLEAAKPYGKRITALVKELKFISSKQNKVALTSMRYFTIFFFLFFYLALSASRNDKLSDVRANLNRNLQHLTEKVNAFNHKIQIFGVDAIDLVSSLFENVKTVRKKKTKKQQTTTITSRTPYPLISNITKYAFNSKNIHFSY